MTTDPELTAALADADRQYRLSADGLSALVEDARTLLTSDNDTETWAF